MRCAIWYHLDNSKNVKITHRGVLLIVKLLAFTFCRIRTKHGEILCSNRIDCYVKQVKNSTQSTIIAPYMCLEKKKKIMKAYIISQFGYCPLAWMFHSKDLNNKINSLHERTLRIAYRDRSSFQDLLRKDNEVFIHHRNIQALATEMFKVKNNIALEIMKELFAPKMSLHDRKP